MSTPLTALGYLAVLLLLLVALPLQALLALATAPFDRNRWAPGRFLRVVGVLMARCYPPWRLRVEGRWPEGGHAYVVVANHQSMLDILLLSHIPKEMKWVGKEELFRIPWIGWMLRLTGDIAVKRGDADSGTEALDKARAYLSRGMSVMFFPEGTRSKTGKLLPFKSGAFRLAIDAGVPVLPVAVQGTAEGMPKGSPWVRPCDAWARILEPVPTAGLGPDDTTKLRDQVRARIAAAVPGAADPAPPSRPAGEKAPAH
ncbi:MAG TPA: lysophospholipid acyltransferase family protein [Anaeromyxobacteraceae bacterium]|nr:lysophospholipid acyltransferase family protein [Anaeromyxobacteraceae bacterium]